MYRKILVPLDGTIPSEAILLEAKHLGEAPGVAIRLLHVAAPVSAIVEDGRVVRYADEEMERVSAECRRYLTAAATVLAGTDVELAVRFGDPAEKILAEAAAVGADLIVMATHRRRGLGRLILGSVAERVARNATVPVLLGPYGTPEATAGAGATKSRHIISRHFWCAWSQRDVEVEFEARGFPGLRVPVAVKGCTAFDPPRAIECPRRCLDPAFRRQSEPVLPLHGRPDA